MRKSTIALISLFLIIACSSSKHTKPKDNGRFEHLTTKIIHGADVLSTLEIDSGRYTLLMYEYSSGSRYRTHSFHGQNIYIKVDSLEIFHTKDSFEIPSQQIDVRAYFSNYRCFVCKVDSIYGSIQKIRMNADSVTLAIDLRYEGRDELLIDTVTFALDKDFFKTFFVDYNGEYDNLRIALKEPLKVKKLELFGYMLSYGLDSLPESFGEMKNLEELNLSNLDLKQLPASFSNLTSLKKLNLGYNDFEAFPTQIYDLKNLEVLDLSLSHLDSIPPGIGKLNNLKSLTLDDNRFKDFPFAITELTNLEHLSITSSNISSIPFEITNLKKLKRLDLSSFWSYKDKNQISDISYLTALTNLESLDLNWNTMERLPDNLCDLKNLKKLSLLSTPIASVPETIRNCGIDTIAIGSDYPFINTQKTKGHKRKTSKH